MARYATTRARRRAALALSRGRRMPACGAAGFGMMCIGSAEEKRRRSVTPGLIGAPIGSGARVQLASSLHDK
ncbi:hypothetical protein [Paraburkholderia sp. BCC1885]|uniref:hypothetical protein n=1 Tax=Paraburkholderia sp. BCC1885 TaxID=2562669 RepID=UPI001182F82F|nr:hypothetical protein [Paraburkholderia sp. BCC1885]